MAEFPIRIVALDLSLTSTGIADNGPDPIWTAALANSKTGVERLAWIRDQIRYACADPIHPADLVLIEAPAYSRNGAYAREGAELAGIVKVGLWEWGYPTLLVSSTAIKKYATGNGSSAKPKVAMEAVHRGGRTFDTMDESDAWWLLQMALAHYDLPHVTMPALNRAVLDKVAWPTLLAPEVPA